MDADASQLNTTIGGTNRSQYLTNFKEKLVLPESNFVKEKMMNFINKVRGNFEKNTESTSYKLSTIKDFIKNLSDDFQKIWKENLENYENNAEAIENIICKTLNEEQLKMAKKGILDKAVNEKMIKYANIKPEHLEIPENITASKTYSRAIQDLQKVSKFKCPKDKLICIVNACKLVNGMVWDISQNKDVPSGADDFLPALIFTTIKASPEAAYTNLNYVRELRNTDLLKGATDYYLTAYESVLDFIERLDISRLKISQLDYQLLFGHNNDKVEIQEADQVIKEKFYPNETPSKSQNLNNLSNYDENNDLLKSSEKQNQSFILNQSMNINSLRSFLYNNFKNNIKFEGKNLNSISLDQIDAFFFEYKEILKNYKAQSEKVEELTDIKNSANVNKESEKNSSSQEKTTIGNPLETDLI